MPAASGHAQTEQQLLDSCYKLLPVTPDDSAKANLMFFIGQELWFARRLPQAIDTLKLSIQLADKHKYYRHTANARLLLANVFINSGMYDSAFDYLRTARAWAEKLQQAEHLPKIDELYAYLYNFLGDEKKGISYSLAAIDGFEKSTIWEINIQSVFALIELGRIFEHGLEYDKALYYYNKALDKGLKDGENHYWYTKAPMINIANVYFKQSRYKEAGALFKQVVDMDTTVIDIDNTTSALNGLGQVEIRQAHYKDAVVHFKRSLLLCTAYHFTTRIDECYLGIGYAFLLDDRYDSAGVYLQKGLQQATITNDKAAISDACKYLAQLYELRGNLKQALLYERLYKQADDSIYNRNKLAIVNNLEVLYQTNQKEKQIVTLQAVNAEKELQLVKHSRLLIITGIIICVLIAFCIFFFYSSKQKQLIVKQQQLLQQKKITELEQQQKVMVLQSLVAGGEAERSRMARDLHDGLGGLFATVKMHLSALKHEYAVLEDDALFKKSYTLVDEAAEELRRIAHNMMPEVLVKLGLIQALADFCAAINAKGSVNILLQAYGMDKRLPADKEIIIFRIVQELVTNIIKHAGATNAIVQFNRLAGKLHIIVEDNGKGFNVNDINLLKPHAGLDSIKSRVEYLKGSMLIDSKTGIGTTVTIELTLEE